MRRLFVHHHCSPENEWPKLDEDCTTLFWAAIVVQSRSYGAAGAFGADVERGKALVPLGDMFNSGTDSEVNVRWEFDDEEQCFRYHAMRDLAKDAELLVSYQRSSHV